LRNGDLDHVLQIGIPIMVTRQGVFEDQDAYVDEIKSGI
jgi:hypothetical protein